jgi:Uma2 family endonuclease
VVGELHLLLRLACPPQLQVLLAPFDVALAGDTVMQPDLLVARRRDLTHRDLPTSPVLAVEVLSPSTRRIDLLLKRSRFEAAGCPAYWVIDPQEPSITAWELDDDAYGEPMSATGAVALHLTAPFEVTVVPAKLTEG